jgi:hypothetical protein
MGKTKVSKMKNRLPILLFAVLLSCGQGEKRFDKSSWGERDDMFYANRESMVRDLMDNHLRIGMSYAELTELVGKPENYGNMERNIVAYEIMVNYRRDIDPVEGKTLIIKLSEDSTVMEYNLKRWKH